jgi:LmbE family N-acetylglucosaminyl deacetylase
VAAKLLDMEPVFLELNEGGFRNNEEACCKVVETIREYQPSVIVVHPPRDYHSDHMETSRCVEDAIYRAGNSAYDAEGNPAGGIMLYYCDAWVMPFEPDVYVDVSEYIQLKRDALACHKSQIGPDGPARGDMIDVEETRARYRGFESGCEYAEAFRLAPRPSAVRKVDLLT